MKKRILLICISVFFVCVLILATSLESLSSELTKILQIHFIDVGLGDSTFIALPNGENLLIDTGGVSAGPKIVQYLKSLGVSQIDHMILTHPHDDHIGGIFSIMSEFQILRFYDNGLSNFKSLVYEDYISLVRSDLSKYNILQAGESLSFGKTRIKVFNPLLPPIGDPNNDSIVLKISYEDIKILLAADLGHLGEQRLLKTDANVESQILKAAHHGDSDATSEAFLQKIKPDIAIISVSMVNKYVRPHQKILERLSQIGAKIYRTDLHGTILLTSDGTTFSLSTEK